MGRLKGSLNTDSEQRPITSKLSPEDRIHFLANLIIDRILEDHRKGQTLLKNIIKK